MPKPKNNQAQQLEGLSNVITKFEDILNSLKDCQAKVEAGKHSEATDAIIFFASKHSSSISEVEDSINDWLEEEEWRSDNAVLPND